MTFVISNILQPYKRGGAIFREGAIFGGNVLLRLIKI